MHVRGEGRHEQALTHLPEIPRCELSRYPAQRRGRQEGAGMP